MTRSASVLTSVLIYLLFASLALSIGPSRLEADDDTASIYIELNKTEETEQGCRPLFLFDNQSGHQLNRFQIELVLFDHEGIHSKQILLDMAPLYEGKKTVASFLLTNVECQQIGSMLINDLPDCKNSVGGSLDCLSLLQVTSRSDIPLEK